MERSTGLQLLLHPHGFCLSELAPALVIKSHHTFLQLGCSTSHMSGTLKESGDYDINMGCNSDFPNNCSCPVSRMQPICSKDDLTNFYSPCHAGCKQLQAFQEPTQMQVGNHFHTVHGTTPYGTYSMYIVVHMVHMNIFPD